MGPYPPYMEYPVTIEPSCDGAIGPLRDSLHSPLPRHLASPFRLRTHAGIIRLAHVSLRNAYISTRSVDLYNIVAVLELLYDIY